MSVKLVTRLLLVVLLGIAAVAHSEPEFRVTPKGIPQVAVVGGGFAIQPNFTFQVTVTNIGDQAATGIVGRVSSMSPAIVVVDNRISVGMWASTGA